MMTLASPALRVMSAFFQRLIAEVGLNKAGLVISLDASRLARNNRDW
ncbi:hypothetical protein SAMN02746095_03001 [Acidocella aminolytica 101 = DSM 11237]|nr:hypothetical protein SAMN02746095_03001 [Acidocella aminolytica 101 = DSM 11237]